MKNETATLRRLNNRRHSCFLTHGSDDYDHRGANRARREVGKAIIRDWHEADTEPAPAPKATQPTTFRIVLNTQIHENYGTHCCECETDESCTCRPYWKAKGGSEYQQPIGSANDVLELGAKGVQEIADKLAAKVARDDRYWQEYAIGWSVIPSTEETYEEQMLREMHEEGYLAPGARTEAERTAYYQDRLARLQAPAL